MVCDGFGHGLQLLAGTLRARGHDRIAVEEPGYNGPRLLLEAMGLRHSAVDVDDEGIIVDKLRRSAARAVVVTPAHQSPTGVVLSPQRRHALIEWAHDVDGYVIEDDYDAEYRYDRRPVGAMQGIAPERVIYARHHLQDAGTGTSSGLDGPSSRAGGAGRERIATQSVGARRCCCNQPSAPSCRAATSTATCAAPGGSTCSGATS